MQQTSDLPACAAAQTPRRVAGTHDATVPDARDDINADKVHTGEQMYHLDGSHRKCRQVAPLAAAAPPVAAMPATPAARAPPHRRRRRRRRRALRQEMNTPGDEHEPGDEPAGFKQSSRGSTTRCCAYPTAKIK
eukprot:1628270-Prymnesium_polylepis.1